MFGWFSKTQAATLGFAIYKSVDGKTVCVSEVTDDHHRPTKWNDVEYVGEVIDIVGSHHVNDAYEELTEHDFISEKELILTDIKQPNAKQDWVSVFTKQVNVLGLFGIGMVFADKHPRYYGAD